MVTLQDTREMFEQLKKHMAAGTDTPKMWADYRALRDSLKISAVLKEVKICTCGDVHMAAVGLIAEDGHLSYECPSCETSLLIKAGYFTRKPAA